VGSQPQIPKRTNTIFILHLAGSSINSMVLGGLALALSRLIDNSVVVLENIFRHLEEGESPGVAAERGGQEVALPVLAGTLTTVVVFFPMTMLYGVSRFLFSALALAVVISLFASYFVALKVVPLFCAQCIKSPHGEFVHESAETEHAIAAEDTEKKPGPWARFNAFLTSSLGSCAPLRFKQKFSKVYTSVRFEVMSWTRGVKLDCLRAFAAATSKSPRQSQRRSPCQPDHASGGPPTDASKSRPRSLPRCQRQYPSGSRIRCPS
jgi:hypothetical protein